MPPTLLEQVRAAEKERYPCWNGAVCQMPKTQHNTHCTDCRWQGMGVQELDAAKKHGHRRTDHELLERAAALIRITKET